MRTASRARSPSEIRWLSERLFGTGFGRLLTAAKEVSPISGRACVRPRYATFCTLFDFEAVFSPKGVVRRIPHDRAARTVLCAHGMIQSIHTLDAPTGGEALPGTLTISTAASAKARAVDARIATPVVRTPPARAGVDCEAAQAPEATPSSKRFVSAPGARCSSAATLVSLSNQVDAGAELRISKSRAREIQTRAVRELQ